MNVFSLIPLTAAIVNIGLSLFVFVRGPRIALNQIYAVWGLSIALWNTGVYFIFRSTTEHEALLWARWMQVGVIFLPICLYHLSRVIAQLKIGRETAVFYVCGVIFVITDYAGGFIAGVRSVGYAYYSIAGPAFWVFLVIYITNAIATVAMLYRKQKSVSLLQRNRLRLLIIGTVILIVFGSNDLLPIIGIDAYPLIGCRIYPLGSLAAVFYGMIVAYSVLQYQLLDIHLTLSRFAAQLVRCAFMSLVGFLLLLLLARLAPLGQFTPFAFFGGLAVVVLSAVIASFLFPQFFGRGSDALERQILGDRFEYHTRVQNFIQSMRVFPEPEILISSLDDLLVNTVKVRSYQVILLNEVTREFRVYRSFPPRPDETLRPMRADSPVLTYFRQHPDRFLSCNPTYETFFELPLEEKHAREDVRPYKAEFGFPFFVGTELIGFMLLGPKVSQDVYTPHDLHLLGELSSSLGLILNQIRLRHQLQLAHEQDLLGRMSHGLAHDLNNLLTPVHTLLQLLAEVRVKRETLEELLPMALRNMETIRDYVNESLFFSQTSGVLAGLSALEATVRDAIAIVARSAASRNVEIRFVQETETLLEMDAVLIKRLICNLLSNAIDASSPGSAIDIRISALPSTEPHREWSRLEIVDRGEGISPENLERVFTPYFTTKNTGDKNRGFGLGLAIARKIVHLHGGNLSIVSREKSGTTVQVDLPSKLSASPNHAKTASNNAAEGVVS